MRFLRIAKITLFYINEQICGLLFPFLMKILDEVELLVIYIMMYFILYFGSNFVGYMSITGG